jgi:hypothetical protein
MAVADTPLMTDISDEEFERRTLAAIEREFGLGGLARFLMTHRSGKGNYTEERREWVEKLSLDDILRDLEAIGGIQH